MRTISILIKINLFILAFLIVGLIAEFIGGGTTILLPGLGLIISVTALLIMLVVVNIAVTLILLIVKRIIARSHLR